MSDVLDLAGVFEAQRPYLRTVALRMLGSGDDADDAIQETWLRLQRAGGEGSRISGVADDGDEPRVIRTCCGPVARAARCRGDRCRSRAVERLRTRRSPRRRPRTSPARRVVGLALHVVMDNLTPAERSRSCCTTSSASRSARSPRSSAVRRMP